MEIKYYLTPILSFLIAILLIPVLRKVAVHFQLVDKPNVRKVHSDRIPLVGGLGIFMAAGLTLSLVLSNNKEMHEFANVFISALILLIMGVIDDKYDLNASLKLIIQLLLAHFIYVSGIKIENLHGIFGIYHIEEWAQYLLTVITITGVVNSFNLMDGIDGLAGGLSITALTILSGFAMILGLETLAIILISFIGAIVAFLRFNLDKNNKVFMGDAGSLVIGFILVVSGIKLLQTSQENIQLSMVMFGVIATLIIPVLDALRVFRKRLKMGKSPFKADRTHLHHLMLSTGLKHKSAALWILTLMGLIILSGLLIYQASNLTLSLIGMLLVFHVLTSILKFNDHLKIWKVKIQKMENFSSK